MRVCAPPRLSLHACRGLSSKGTPTDGVKRRMQDSDRLDASDAQQWVLPSYLGGAAPFKASNRSPVQLLLLCGALVVLVGLSYYMEQQDIALQDIEREEFERTLPTPDVVRVLPSGAWLMSARHTDPCCDGPPHCP